MCKWSISCEQCLPGSHTAKTCVMNLTISRISWNPCFLYSISWKRSAFASKLKTPNKPTKPNLSSFLINCFCGYPQHMYLITLVFKLWGDFYPSPYLKLDSTTVLTTPPSSWAYPNLTELQVELWHTLVHLHLGFGEEWGVSWARL